MMICLETEFAVRRADTRRWLHASEQVNHVMAPVKVTSPPAYTLWTVLRAVLTSGQIVSIAFPVRQRRGV